MTTTHEVIIEVDGIGYHVDAVMLDHILPRVATNGAEKHMGEVRDLASTMYDPTGYADKLDLAGLALYLETRAATLEEFTFDTNAGPIVHLHADNIEAAKAKALSQVPMAARRGYTVEWSQNNGWTVATVFNSKGRKVHAFAIRPGWRA